jgi:hypothetical protein
MSDLSMVAAADATSLDDFSEGEGGGMGEIIEGFHPMTRGINSLMRGSEALGLASKETLAPLEKISAALEITLGGFMMYRSVKEIVTAVQGVLEAQAAIEAAAAAVDPLMWGNLALATGVAAATFSAVEFASGQWQFPAIDINDPAQRAQAGQQLRSVATAEKPKSATITSAEVNRNHDQVFWDGWQIWDVTTMQRILD